MTNADKIAELTQIAKANVKKESKHDLGTKAAAAYLDKNDGVLRFRKKYKHESGYLISGRKLREFMVANGQEKALVARKAKGVVGHPDTSAAVDKLYELFVKLSKATQPPYSKARDKKAVKAWTECVKQYNLIHRKHQPKGSNYRRLLDEAMDNGKLVVLKVCDARNVFYMDADETNIKQWDAKMLYHMLANAGIQDA